MPRSRVVPLVTLALMASVSLARAATVDGQLDSEYGSVLSTQATQTGLGDTPPGYNPFDPLTRSLGSELDVAYGYISGGTLYLFFGGNFKNYQGEPLILPDQLQIFIDCAPGGQNTLRSDNAAVGNYLDLTELSGLTFDSDFSADYWLEGGVEYFGSQSFMAFAADLPTASGGSGSLLGWNGGGGTGTLSGGTNPFGILASIDQTNRAGVTAGCDAGDGSGVTTGMEFGIPLAAIGNPSEAIRVCAFIGSSYIPVSNQVLGPLPPGTCPPGAASGVSFANIPGAQFFTVDRAVPTEGPSWGRLKLRYR
jgi:hypothetical protein